MDTVKLKKLIEIVRNSGISELEISDSQEKIRIANTNSTNQNYQVNQSPKQNAVDFTNQNQTINDSSIEATANNKKNDKQKIIKSPMVGTFYRATAPGAEPLAEVGQKVKKGDVVCIIEAMKLMNEIVSDFEGVIKEILINNDQPVEYGESLFVVE